MRSKLHDHGTERLYGLGCEAEAEVVYRRAAARHRGWPDPCVETEWEVERRAYRVEAILRPTLTLTTRIRESHGDKADGTAPVVVACVEIRGRSRC